MGVSFTPLKFVFPCTRQIGNTKFLGIMEVSSKGRWITIKDILCTDTLHLWYTVQVHEKIASKWQLFNSYWLVHDFYSQTINFAKLDLMYYLCILFCYSHCTIFLAYSIFRLYFLFGFSQPLMKRMIIIRYGLLVLSAPIFITMVIIWRSWIFKAERNP